LHLLKPAHRNATSWLAAIVGSAVLLLAVPAASHAAIQEPLSDFNNYECTGHTQAGPPELGSSEQQVQYTISCDGPITGYQLETQIPLTGVSAAPITESGKGVELTDTFSCQGELPGYAVNCVGLAQEDWETITGEFAIATPICAEPRVDPLLTVTYAATEAAKAKGEIPKVTQAISGPFDLGRPHGCRGDKESGGDRLHPKAPVKHKAKAKAKKTARRASHRARKASRRK
jgi:hypothetical protein